MTAHGIDNKLNKRKLKAAQLLADGQLTKEQVAHEVGVHRRTLQNWMQLSAFQNEVQRCESELRATVRAQGIANKQNRVEAINRRWQGLLKVIEERAADPASQNVPGGSTGLLMRQEKLVKVYAVADENDIVKSARQSKIVEEFNVDSALLRELRELEKQGAIETGQWQEEETEAKSPLIMVVGDEALAAL